MGKNTNPADAFRKAQRKKELRKNKATRKNTRDFALVKKDTWDLQDEIERLEGASKPDDHDKARLAELKAELETINKKKAEWVEEHPEHRRLVYRPRKETDTTKLELEMLMAKPRRNYFLPNGLPRHPERSVYYDPVMNPYGVAPPGMPYRERDLLPGEVDSEAEDSDGDIAMPEGPPPNGEDPVGSDEDIPMPEGLPPGQDQDIPMPQALSMPPPDTHSMPLPPVMQPPPGSFSAPFISPPPPHFFPQNVPPPPNFIHGMPTPPPGFFPRAIDPGSPQGSLASLPIQSIRGHQSQTLPSHASLPPKPTFATPASTTATVSAAPQLRDLKKEATSFVPASLKKKKASTMVASSRINAAPGTGADDEEETNVAPRPNLLSTLQDQFGPGPSVSSKATANAKPPPAAVLGKSKDDYTRFVEEMGNILPPK